MGWKIAYTGGERGENFGGRGGIGDKDEYLVTLKNGFFVEVRLR